MFFVCNLFRQSSIHTITQNMKNTMQYIICCETATWLNRIVINASLYIGVFYVCITVFKQLNE